jgi:ribosome biogenesis GTPase
MSDGPQTQVGLVIASYGRRGILETADGRQHRYLLKGRSLRAVCGDHVSWQQDSGETDALVTAIGERENALERPDSRGKPELIAANLSQLVVVLAPAPQPDFFLADRYLCAAELMDAAAMIIWNKADLQHTLPAELSIYQQLGYPVLPVSAETGAGIDALTSQLAKGISMLVGQSGVGKSSIINRLVPAAEVAVSELSVANKEGRHTTTASFMHDLPHGGRLIDSPGVREFAPLVRDEARIQNGFREILQLAADCRFSNCQHMREPDCAVKAACAAEAMDARRYESYKRLRHTTAALR